MSPRNARVVPIVRPAKLPTDCRFARARQAGYMDARARLPYRDAYDTMTRKEQYAYERGRIQAVMARALAGGRRTPPAWPDAVHIRPLLVEFLGAAKAFTLFQETGTGRDAR